AAPRACASLDPSPPRSPWNTGHRPGGSPSGSAAAVGARTAPLALGTQTVGSVLRPAAYCGVGGVKPSHGRIGTPGVGPLGWSLDHVGIMARGVEDAALALSVLAGPDRDDPLSIAAPVEDYVAATREPAAPRIGVLRALVERAEPEVARHVGQVAQELERAGA